jgi:hypothetical protein
VRSTYDPDGRFHSWMSGVESLAVAQTPLQ